MFLEVIGLTPQDVVAAQNGGAHRIELVSSMQEDGLSPALSTIESVLSVATIPVRVMVRFHNRGFIYSRDETTKMVDWITQIQRLPVDGFVLGGLTERGQIDEDFLVQCLDAIDGKGCTFHRAFDRVNDQFQALSVLTRYAVDTILTSGGLQSDIERNIPHLINLHKAAPSITILLGGGVTPELVHRCQGTVLTHFHAGGACRHQGDFTQPVSSELVKSFFL